MIPNLDNPETRDETFFKQRRRYSGWDRSVLSAADRQTPKSRTPVRIPCSSSIPKAKKIIYVFVDGGLSQIDSFDPKPKMGEVMMDTKLIDTKIDGDPIRALLPPCWPGMQRQILPHPVHVDRHRLAWRRSLRNTSQLSARAPPIIRPSGHGFPRCSPP